MYAKSKVLCCIYRNIYKNTRGCFLNNFYRASEQLSSKSKIHNIAREKAAEERKNAPVNKFVNRTHTCGELTINNVGERVDLCGWLQFHRCGKFLVLRDAYGITQCIFSQDEPTLLSENQKLSLESVLKIRGIVVPRPKGQENEKMPTGEIEVMIESLEVSNPADSNFPFPIRNVLIPKESTSMKHRYLALRFPQMQKNLRLRSWVVSKMRNYLLENCEFVEIETPTLFKRTPGGAQEFVVPTQLPGKFYSLVQSPQQLKQLLMVGAIDRYFQVARCYRDEGSKNDRQPEFTQLDVELSFVDTKGVMELTENIIKHSWPTNFPELPLPFPTMTYKDCMEIYGSDKPDLRIPEKMKNVTKIISQSSLREKFDVECNEFGAYSVVFKENFKYLTQKAKNAFSTMAKNEFPDVILIQLKTNGNDWMKKLENLISAESSASFVNQTGLEENSVLFLALGNKENAQKLIGKLRVEFADTVESNGPKIRSDDFRFLWVTDFPLFEKDCDGENLIPTHHPFTSPRPEDFHLLSKDPSKIMGLHYDLVLNGSEIAGGSIRIHDHTLQRQILQLLKIESSEMEYFLDALKYGAPPHGGIAIGLDRYISILCGGQSIRDVIAFPKTVEGKDVMTGAPSNITEKEKKLYSIKTL